MNDAFRKHLKIAKTTVNQRHNPRKLLSSIIVFTILRPMPKTLLKDLLSALITSDIIPTNCALSHKNYLRDIRATYMVIVSAMITALW